MVRTLFVHPIKSLLTFIFVSCAILVMLLTPADAVATVGAISNVLYLSAGVAIGSIPPGIESFRNGFEAMSKSDPRDFSVVPKAGGNG